jgi:hypothetical protein
MGLSKCHGHGMLGLKPVSSFQEMMEKEF